MCYLYKRCRRDGLVRVWLLPREMSKARACGIVCWPVSEHVRVWIISGYGAAASWRLAELPDSGHYALGIPANDSVGGISHRPRNALASPGPYGNDGFFSCEAFLGQVDLDVNPFAIGGVWRKPRPGLIQHGMEPSGSEWPCAAASRCRRCGPGHAGGLNSP